MSGERRFRIVAGTGAAGQAGRAEQALPEGPAGVGPEGQPGAWPAPDPHIPAIHLLSGATGPVPSPVIPELALTQQYVLSSDQLHSAILCVSAYGCGWSCSVAGKRHELREVLRGMFYHALCQCTCCGWSCSVIGK